MNENGFGNPLPTPEEYALYVGPKAHVYLPKFGDYAMTPAGFGAGWNWSCFFFGPWWFLYRKMYLWALLCLMTLLIFNVFFLVNNLLWSIASNWLYFRQATAKIREVREFNPQGYAASLPRLGGVNSWVPWVAVIFTLISCFFLFVVLGLSLSALLIIS